LTVVHPHRDVAPYNWLFPWKIHAGHMALLHESAVSSDVPLLLLEFPLRVTVVLLDFFLRLSSLSAVVVSDVV